MGVLLYFVVQDLLRIKMRILALLFFIIFFPIKIFAIPLEVCIFEQSECSSSEGTECFFLEQNEITM